jgi:two-component SAPR family response regulator
MIIAIAVDDEPPALRVVEKFCNEVDFIDLVKTFTRPLEAVKYLNKFPVDLLFLDIRMPFHYSLQ